MIPYVLFTIDISTDNTDITEEAFRESVAPCLNRL